MIRLKRPEKFGFKFYFLSLSADYIKMKFNFRDVSEKFSFTSQVLGKKMQKSTFLKKRLLCSFNKIEVHMTSY